MPSDLNLCVQASFLSLNTSYHENRGGPDPCLCGLFFIFGDVEYDHVRFSKYLDSLDGYFKRHNSYFCTKA